MDDAITDNRKKRGRPRVGSTLIGLRLDPDMLAWLDAERAKVDPVPSRPEFIRQLIEREKSND